MKYFINIPFDGGDSKKKKLAKSLLVFLLLLIFIFTLSACGSNLAENIPDHTTDDSAFYEDGSIPPTDDASDSAVEESQSSNDKSTNESEATSSSEKSNETESTQKPTAPANTKPAPTNPPPQVNKAGKGDEQAVAQKVLEYINQFRVEGGVPAATKLPGLTKYAEYRSRQLVKNPHHNTNEERAAATALKYGDYIDPKIYGMTGEPYYEVNAREAICGGAGSGTIDEVALRLATLLYESSNHWAYVGSTEYKFVAVGVTYAPSSLYGWYCCVNMARIDLDQSYNYHA